MTDDRSQSISFNKDILVYIPDLPLDIPEDELIQMIKNRLENSQRMIINDIKCYFKLGIGIIRMMNEEDKKHLVFTVESIVLDKQRGLNISFVDKLELDSYIVVDQNMSRIPSSNEVARRYTHAYNIEEACVCESISVQFPNIFHIVLNTFDELDTVTKSPDFKIENNFATVYPYAECSFFEDLPSNISNDKISSSIAAQIGEKDLLTTLFYVQFNEQTCNAIVLAGKSAKKWILEGNLTIDGQTLSKKTRLAYRVLVSPVPCNANINRILNHKLFNDKVISSNHINDHLIIELNDMTSYEYCLDMGALAVDGQTMTIKAHTVVNDSERNEINAINWYETDMLDIKPDIMTIIHNNQHPILHLKWNAKTWLEQMQQTGTLDKRSKRYDTIRHLLRVTVMINTIATVRKKKYVIDNEEIILKSERLKTIGYDHKSKLSYGKKISQIDFKIPFSSTTVKVINEDCLILYEKLVSQGYQPVLLNMANATNPGGGYRKGDGAQEENLFRRSDYYQSLDIEVADRDRSEQFYCTSNCDLKRSTNYTSFYPMEEFGAIYTSGITVFRQIEENGYDYMNKPLYNVCSIAMAAYRNPDLNKKNMLQNKFAINTYKKLENIFSIAHHHKHDCLVLSAFGCGAFKNPPEHIALLFKSIIYQYAGYFKYIYFAIIDDHNTGYELNPQGNFIPFKNKLDNLIVYPSKTIRINTVSGPYRILDKSSDGKLTLSDVCILYLPPCQHGSTCRDLKNIQHNKEYFHPSICSLQDEISSCDQINDEVHMFIFIHNSLCKKGGECDNKDPKHLSEYDHPDFCKDQSHCIDISSEHLFAYRHLPICRNGIECIEYLRNKSDHCNLFRHCRSICPYDNCCVNFHDQEHIKNTIHSFRTPCSFTPYNCELFVKYIQANDGENISYEIENHCLKYSHVCPFGRQCKNKDETHYLTSIHIARQFCPDEDKCLKLTQEDHLESFSHSGIRDIRLFCREPGFKCHIRFKDDHLKRYRHGQNYNHFSVAPSSNLNSSVNFFYNQGQMIRNLNNYIDALKWEKGKISPEILKWIRSLQPTHRCSKHIFESILIHGHVMSRHYMELLKRPKYVVKAVLQHGRVRLIFLKHNTLEVKQNVHELIKMLVEGEFAKKGCYGTPSSLDPDHKYNIHKIERRLKPPLDDRDIEVIRKWSIKIALASIDLHSNPMGIGYDVDQIMGTDQHVFSILGPHLGHYYGDIIIVFKKEIMFHPDANFSIQAATSFGPHLNAYIHRPWLKDPGNQEKRVEHFYRSKLHCSVPHYEDAAAKELIALTGKNKNTMNINLEDVIHRWMTVDSHEVFEGHLPQLIPLDYIDYVYMPKNIFDSLTFEAQRSAKAVFNNSLIITDHQIDLSLIKPSGTIPLDSSRKLYQKYVLEKICQQIEKKMNISHISRGIVITVPGTKFEEHIVLPMTISQSYGLYCLDNGQSTNNLEFTYIYWQAMNGDFMLTISNEKIQTDRKDQSNLRCLICYLAEKPSTSIENYHEMYSYLNIGHPYEHYNNIYTKNFKAKSNVFYRGCNTDDFLTFCLKLNHKTGHATLFHAGPNGIYNHEKINYQFNKTELDLSRIDYIHVSAGTQDVPIRNLTINHEPITDLHPSFDKDFKVDTSTLLKKHRTYDDQIVRAPQYVDIRNRSVSPKSYRKRFASSQPLSRKPSSSKEKNQSFIGRIFFAICGSSLRDQPLQSIQSISDTPRMDLPKYDRSRSKLTQNNQSRSESLTPDRSKNKLKRISPIRASSKLPPCRDSIYCLNLNIKEHTEKYSHPCRFNELCRNQVDEPHLVHEHHKVPQCSNDKNCSKKIDPVHRSQYRHTNLPDYLFPCRYQKICYDKSPEHRIKYFHGEELPSIKKNKTLIGNAAKPRLIPCRYRNKCKDIKNPQHLSKYSHPTY